VKKLVEKSLNKHALAAIWKLCSNTIKGYLTKGEFFVFLNIVEEYKKTEKIINVLSSETKELIKKIDSVTVKKENVRESIRATSILDASQPFLK